MYGTTCFGTLVDISDVNYCLDGFDCVDGIENSNQCMSEFNELIGIMKPELKPPTSSEEARSLFIELTQLLDNL